MYSIFLTKDIQVLHDTYIWVYSTYSKKGFSFEYFYYELEAWRESFSLVDEKTLSSIRKLLFS